MLVARFVGSAWRDAAAAAQAARAEALDVRPADADAWIHDAASIIPVRVRLPGTAMTPGRLPAVRGESMPRPGPVPVEVAAATGGPVRVAGAARD